MSVSRPGLAVMTVQFKVGVPRTEALVRLYDTSIPMPTGCRRAWASLRADHQAEGHRRRADRHADALQQEPGDRRLRPGARRPQHRGRPQARAGNARSDHHRRARARGAGRARPGAHGRHRRHRRRPAHGAAVGQPRPAGRRPAGRQPRGRGRVRAVPARTRAMSPSWSSACATASRCSCRTSPPFATARCRPSRYVWHGRGRQGRRRVSGGDHRGDQEAGRERDRRRQRGDAPRRDAAQHGDPARRRGRGDAQLRRHRQRQGA